MCKGTDVNKSTDVQSGAEGQRGRAVKGLVHHTRKSVLFPGGNGKLRTHISPSCSQGYQEALLNALLKSSYIMSMALPWSSSLAALTKKRK